MYWEKKNRNTKWFKLFWTIKERILYDTHISFLGLLYHKLVGLKQEKFIFSQVWKVEVQNQDLGRAMLLLKTVVESFFDFS